MTHEQFRRALEIDKRLHHLEDVKRAIADKVNCRLSYVYREDDELYYPLEGVPMCYILGDLARHDEALRKEIDEEIEALKKEIETL